MKKHNGKKLLAVLLVIMLAVPASLAAFAETITEPVWVSGWDGHNNNETVNANVDVDGGIYYETAVGTNSGEGSSATLTVNGDVSVEGSGSSGARADSNDSGSVSTTVINGDVEASSNSNTNDAEGVSSHAYEGGTASVTVNGDVSSTDVGADAYAAGGTAEIAVNGDVEAGRTGVTANVNPDWNTVNMDQAAFEAKVSGDPDDTWDGTVNGDGSWWTYESWHDGKDEYRIETRHYKENGVDKTEVYYCKMTPQDLGGSAEITVDGNVTASNSEGAATGVNVYTSEEVTGAEIDVTVTGDVTASGTQNQNDNYSSWTEGVNVNGHSDAEVTVRVDGDVTATSTQSAQGVSASAYDDSVVTVDVGGSVTASATEDVNGVNARTEGGTLNLTVGDITSDGTGLTASSQGGDVTVTTGDVTSGKDAVQATLNPKRDYNEISASEFNAAVSGIGSVGSWENPPSSDGSYWAGESWQVGDAWYYSNVRYDANGTVLESNYNKQVPYPTSGTVNVTVDGDVNAVCQDNGVNGVWTYGNELASGTIDVTVTGDVNVQGAESSGPYGSWTAGAAVNAKEDVNATVTIGGNVSAVSEAEAYGVNVNVWDTGTADVTVGGTVTAKGGSEWDTAVSVSVSGEEASATVQTGDVVGDETGVQVSVTDGTATVTTGSVTATQNAVSANLNGPWNSTEMTAAEFAALDLGDPDNVYEENRGNGTTWTWQEWYFNGINYRVGTSGEETTYVKNETMPSGGAITLNVNGDVTANNEDGFAAAVNAYTGSKVTGGELEVNVNGDVTATSAGDANAIGILANTESDSSTVLTVNVVGDVTASGEDAVGIETYTSGGKINVDVEGNVVSDGYGISVYDGWHTHWEDTTDEIPFDESEYMYTDTWTDENGNSSQVKFYKHKENDKIYWYADNGYKWVVATDEGTEESDTQVKVTGDVTAKEYGAYIEVKNDKAALDLLIDGTLSGEKTSIMLNDDTLPGNVTLTVWEVKANSDGNLAEKETWVYNQDTKKYDQVVSSDTEFEKQIQYIIRLDQPSAGATLSTSGTTSYEGYDVANEGDTVILKINVQSGYYITGAYNGTDTKVELLRDDNGQYYLVVPRGGAVLLSVTLGYEGVAEEEEESTPAPAPVVNNVQDEKMDDEAITAAVEELLTKNDVVENSTVEVKTDDSGVKTVVISPEEIGTTEGEGTEEGEAEEVVLKMTVPAEMLNQLAESDVQQITMVSKSGTAQVTLDTAAILEKMAETTNAQLIVNIEENSEKVQKATEALPAKYTAKAGAVTVTARIVDEDGNTIVLDSSANITIQLNIDFEEGMKILFVDEDGNVTETEAVWVEATEDVPGHWEVPFLGEGTYIPVVEEAAE